MASVENKTEGTFCFPKHTVGGGKLWPIFCQTTLNKIGELVKVGHANDFRKAGGVDTPWASPLIPNYL